MPLDPKHTSIIILIISCSLGGSTVSVLWLTHTQSHAHTHTDSF